MRGYGLAIMLAALVGCARSSVIQTSANTFQVTTSAAPACGGLGAQKVAYQTAAIETIKRGYDRFVILGGGSQNNIRVVGTTPMTATTYGTATANRYGNTVFMNGTANTSFSGGQPIMGGSFDQSFLVQVYKEGDPEGANAVDARVVLGPDWAKLVQKPPVTC